MHIDLGSFRRDSKTGKWKSLSEGAVAKPLFGVPSTSPTYEMVSPYDFATIYNVLPLWTAGIDGTGQTVAIAGRSDISLTDVANFRSAFGLPKKAPTIITNGPDPGVPSTDDKVENTLDVEWSGAVAKGATIKFVTTASTATSDGAQASAQYIIDNKTAYIMSFSYGNCELDFGTAGNAAYNSMWQQGASEGISEFVASGDQGSAACDGGHSYPYGAEEGLAVSATSSTPYDVAVGGTDFTWANSTTTYWSSTNNSTTGASALGYIPEVPWNGTCASYDVDLLYGFIGGGLDEEQSCQYMLTHDFDESLVNVVGGTGGKSACTTPSSNTVASCSGGYAKPSWQTGTGVPADGKRDVPDLSLFASSGALDSLYVICDSGLGPCTFSIESDALAQGVGGTSVASPAMAGIMALVLQKAGGAAQGLPNPMFYKLAAADTLSKCNTTTVVSGNTCNFYDITTDNNAVPCVPGDPNCTVIHTGDEVGILSGYASTTGYDLATGLGSVNANNMVNSYAALVSSPAVLTAPASGSTLGTEDVKFTWSAGVGVTEYELRLGTTGIGSLNLYNSGDTTAKTVTVPSLPANGVKVYARLFSLINGSWHTVDSTYMEDGPPAALATPTPGTALGTTNVTFTWTAGGGVAEYELRLGTTGAGSLNLYNSGDITAKTVTVPSIPANGVKVYARLYSHINGIWHYVDYTYTEQ